MDGRVIFQLSGLILGLIVFIWVVLISGGDRLWLLAAVIGLMLIWWISEAVPLAVTALLPIVLLPLLGVLETKEITPNYTRPIIFLLFAGFTLALAMQRANLHERIVVKILRLTGTHVDAVIFGFMLAACLLSMWLSNTATTAALLPIALSFIAILTSSQHGATPRQPLRPEELSATDRRLALTILLGIAYAANIGGTATLIGTGTNALFAGYMLDHFNINIDFLTWMLMALPFTLVMLLLMWFVLTQILFRNALGDLQGFEGILDEKEEALGDFSYQERAIAILFSLTVLCWIFQRFLPFEGLDNVVIGMAAAICAFAIPIRLRPLEFMLSWRDMRDLPWGVLLLLGGGLALGDAMTRTGFSSYLGEWVLLEFQMLDDHIWIAFAGLGMVLTEFASNVAMLSTLLPVITDIAEKTGANPVIYAVPLTLATSCAFMMPMATPPNALVFASGYIRVSEMMFAGFWLNLIALGVLLLVSLVTVPLFAPAL